MSKRTRTVTRTTVAWEPTSCVECLMTWFLKGDGGVCLACGKPVYYRKENK